LSSNSATLSYSRPLPKRQGRCSTTLSAQSENIQRKAKSASPPRVADHDLDRASRYPNPEAEKRRPQVLKRT
ncbi:hypothetical protein N5079_16880, partial [Planotetraspora sp. A-T 1434]|uniref:hypothetical protein n=1 Tax=Planotetraspora sp. A-T 1434 TaxID=2979219 RepID=UPI0021C13CC9